jgi:hypothetical protein
MRGAQRLANGLVPHRLTLRWLASTGIAGIILAPSSGAQTTPLSPSADSATRTGVAVAADSLAGVGISIADVVYFPGLFGLRVPSYDRSDGVSVPFGPRLALPDDRVIVDALATYRSNLGLVDPSFRGTVVVSHHLLVHALAERATLTNDDWSASDFTNSVGTLIGGADGRNYFRADRAEATLEWHNERRDELLGATAYAGARDEFSHSVGPDSGSSHSVWSLLDQASRGGILRPNPSVLTGHIASGIAGLTGHWASPAGVVAAAKLGVEVPWTSPDGAPFAQVTADASLAFRAFFDHEFSLFTHALATDGATAPPQRFSYVGGTYTLPTLALLPEGGDQLLWVESMYLIPFHALALPYIGAPSIGIRYVVGGAGVHHLPDLTQNVGLRVQLFILRVDGLIDPMTHRTFIALSGTVPRI